MIKLINQPFEHRDANGHDDGIWMQMYSQTFQHGIEIQNNVDSYFFVRTSPSMLQTIVQLRSHLATM